MCDFKSVCFHEWEDVEDVGRVQAAELNYSPVSGPCVPHASVCLCALTVNNNLLYRIKVFQSIP